MNVETYRENEAKYLKLLVAGVGKVGQSVNTSIQDGEVYLESHYPNYGIEQYDPEHNAEQRWELLEWYCCSWKEGMPVLGYIMAANKPPIALILAALELLEVE